MSPEQESGGVVDARSDVYAIGAVIYECLVGEPPPPTPSDLWTPGKRPPSSIGLRLPLDPEDDERMRQARPDSGVHPASRRMPSAAPAALSGPVDVPEAWRVIVERALAKRPEDRYQDARTLLGALRALRAETPAVPAVSGEGHS
jgi:serine/threonine protein kinase